MNFFEKIRKAVRHLFGASNVSKAFGIQIAVSPKMQTAVQNWTEMYEDRPPWKDFEKGKLTMNLPAAISSEIARLVTIEMKSVVSGSPRADYVNQQYQRVIEKTRDFTEKACALGGICLKPYVVQQTGRVDVSIVQAADFYPAAWDSDGDVTAAVFVDTTYINDKRYTRLEYHKLDGTLYTITNKAYCLNTASVGTEQQNTLGREVLLSEVPEWATIEPVVTINGIEHPLFAYFKMPIANSVESTSCLGVSCFSRAVDQIRKADDLWSEMAWEFESGERCVNVPEDMFRLDPDGKPIIPEGRERLYRTFTWDQGKTLDTYSPDFRDESLFNALNKVLHKVEFLCGLATGTFSEPTETDKTATEVKQSKQRSFSTVSDVQKALEKALRGIVYCIDTMATLYELAPEGEYEISYDWDDSIIVDREVEFARLMSMASAGMIRPEYVPAWYFGVSLEDARAMMPDAETDEQPPEEEE